MAVSINGRTPQRGSRGKQYEQAVKRLGDDVIPLLGLARTIEGKATVLNEHGVPSPTGGRWSCSTLRRFMHRAEKLGLPVKVRSLSEAAQTRPYVNRVETRLNRERLQLEFERKANLPGLHEGSSVASLLLGDRSEDRLS